jgi:protein-L-isoaspartate(D-aspartate) O-methyltransferase
VEIIEPLAELARANLKRVGRGGNVTVLSGDASAGCAVHGPYDAISVAAGAPEIPAALFEQLCDPGVLAIPVGEFSDQELRVIEKSGGHMKSRVATLCRFVPLRGSEGWR